MTIQSLFTKSTAAAVALCAFGAAAQAATLSGTFDVRVVNYSFATGQSSSVAIADQSNFDARFNAATDGVDRDTFTYTGSLDFFIPNPRNDDLETIADFFRLNGNGAQIGVISGLDTAVGSLRLSENAFKTTTLFEFTEVFSNDFETRVTHDDGFAIYDDGAEVFAFSNPTGIRTTPKTGTEMFTAGEFRLVYAAANGNPSKLLVEGDGISAVPLPAPALLLLGGMGALAGLRRRKSRG